MDFSTCKHSLDQDAPPESLGQALAALWHAAKGDWDAAVDAAMSVKPWYEPNS